MNDAEEVRSWTKSVDSSLAASLLLGRASARVIAKAHLSELFKLVGGDREAAIAAVFRVESYGSRRLLLESFRLTFSLMNVDSRYHILLADSDLNQKTIAVQYDQALFALLRECGGKKEVLVDKVINFPVAKRKTLLERLEHADFRRLRRVKLSRRMLNDMSNNIPENSPLNWWQWTLLFMVICVFAVIFI